MASPFPFEKVKIDFDYNTSCRFGMNKEIERSLAEFATGQAKRRYIMVNIPFEYPKWVVMPILRKIEQLKFAFLPHSSRKSIYVVILEKAQGLMHALSTLPVSKNFAVSVVNCLLGVAIWYLNSDYFDASSLKDAVIQLPRKLKLRLFSPPPLSFKENVLKKFKQACKMMIQACLFICALFFPRSGASMKTWIAVGIALLVLYNYTSRGSDSLV